MNDLSIRSLTFHSNHVQPGDLFMAVPGATVDGRRFIQQAIERGAVAVLCEEKGWVAQDFEVPVIPVPGLQEMAGHIAARFYGDPTQTLPIIGITGTNGKTSIAHFLAQIFSQVDKPCGVIGTLGTGFIKNLDRTTHTTPDAITVQRILSEFKGLGAKVAAIEVSSHALEQHRIEGVAFHTAIFSNLTHDHLDYHPSMEHYWESKQKLFLKFQPQHSLINVDDDYGMRLFASEKIKGRQIGYTLNAKIPDPLLGFSKDLITTHELTLDENGLHAFLETPWGNGELSASLFGRFNVSNLLAAIGGACLQGVPLNTVLGAVQEIKTVPGRMMIFGGSDGSPTVIVDYAHTPDALAQVLKGLRMHCRGRLWCVFGCGGERDPYKRPLMVSLAEELCDELVLTQDNPRTEDPEQIIREMKTGARVPERIKVELDRRKAIRFAIGRAEAQDFIVVAGKGHEESQIIGQNRHDFSDPVEVQKALEGIPV